jgi:uncharacterized protein YjbJ (UPF0337 family)
MSTNTLIAKGNWHIVSGKLKQKWATLTDDDLKYLDGKQEEMLGRMQKRTGVARAELEKTIREYRDSCDCS